MIERAQPHTSHAEAARTCWYIPTAAYAEQPRDDAQLEAAAKAQELSEALGLDHVETIELDDPACSLAALTEKPTVVYIAGGNTFYLRHHMRRSGFDEVVSQLCAPCDDSSPATVFIGASAGAICLGHSIDPAHWKGWDSPDAVPDVDWSSEASLEGLGLAGHGREWRGRVQGAGTVGKGGGDDRQPALTFPSTGVSFFPHFDPPQHESLVEAKRGRLKSATVAAPEVVTLRDDQAFVWSQTPEEGARSFIFHSDGSLGRLRSVEPLVR